jgi:hypothetical protein
MTQASQALGIEGDFAVMITLLLVSFGHKSRDPAKSQTHIMRFRILLINH